VRILAPVHLYPPDHCAGAELMLHEILLGLRERGHEVAVYVDHSSVGEWEGIPIHTAKTSDLSSLIDGVDVIFTHLDRTRHVIRTNAGRKHLVHLIHNDQQLRFHRVKPRESSLVVANSQWIRKAIKWPGETIVVPPPVHSERYRTTAGDALTLINLGENKGAPLFWQLARILKDKQFVGVKGGYSEQIIPDKIPSNVELVEHTPDIRDVYSLTRILLVPSAYESWGRVGIEAAASGIPTIGHPTPGLLESLGTAGTFADRGNVADWVEAIWAFDDIEHYRKKSEESLARSAELDPKQHIDALDERLREIVRVS
jgi:glycosyltransferase involved in cell wall biosynthesis